MAPFTPFMSEEIYRKLTNKASVHLLDWPKAGHVNSLLIKEMNEVRQIITEGLNQRSKAGIKVRQPLVEVLINPVIDLNSGMLEIIKEELNVKMVVLNNRLKGVVINTTITESLKLEGLSRDLIRHIQEFRKSSNLDVDNRIYLKLETTDKNINKSINKFKKEIYTETLAIGDKITKIDYEDDLTMDTKCVKIYIQIA